MSVSIVRGPEVRTWKTGLVLRDLDTTKSFKFLEGRAVPYGVAENVGWYLEKHEFGSFAKSIKDHPEMPLLLFHDSKRWPIGVTYEWRDNEKGLDCVWRLDDSSEAQRAAKLAKDEMLIGLSIGFVPIRSEWTWAEDFNPSKGPEGMDNVVRKESRLLEVSLTPTPAFSDAQVTLVRSAHPRPTGRARSVTRRRRVDEITKWLVERQNR